MNRIFLPLILICCIFGSCAPGKRAERSSARNIADNYAITGFYDPWDSLENGTKFSCRCDNEYFYFEFVADDRTPVVSEEFPNEHTAVDEDRVEIYFCPDRDMKREYYAAEVDPRGRVLDYSALYPRQFNFDWNFKTLQASGETLYDGNSVTDNKMVTGNKAVTGYKVKAKVSLAELRELGIPTDGTIFWIGLFQADFTCADSVNWFARVKDSASTPDFHKPEMLFPVKIYP